MPAGQPVGRGAAMRKLVHIAYGVLKHQQPYRPQIAAEG